VDDSHYDHGCIEKTFNCVFRSTGCVRWRERDASAGLTEEHFSMAFSQALRELRETTVPQLARAVSSARPDAVLLTGG